MLDRDGFQASGALLVKGAVSAEVADALIDACGCLDARPGPGQRLNTPDARLLNVVAHAGLTRLASELEGETLRPVRFLLFDKTGMANWAVDWHQDRVLPLAEKHVLPGFENWTVKEGVPHVEPPVWLSERMVTLRLHLDDVDAENAPLETLPGSHRLGRVPTKSVGSMPKDDAVVHTARKRDVLAVKTLIVHASRRAVRVGRRRVLHVDFAPEDVLPQPLRWAFPV